MLGVLGVELRVLRMLAMPSTCRSTVPGPCVSYSYLPMTLTLQSRGGCFHRSKQRTLSPEHYPRHNQSDSVRLCQLTPKGTQERVGSTPGPEMTTQARQGQPHPVFTLLLCRGTQERFSDVSKPGFSSGAQCSPCTETAKGKVR